MRQLWISVGILVVMVALLFWNVVKVDQLTQPMLKELSQATTAARGDDWPAAEVLTQQIQVHWEKGMHHLRFVQMHDAIDEVTLLLREAQGYLQDRKTGEAGARLRRESVLGNLPTEQLPQHLDEKDAQDDDHQRFYSLSSAFIKASGANIIPQNTKTPCYQPQ